MAVRIAAGVCVLAGVLLLVAAGDARASLDFNSGSITASVRAGTSMDTPSPDVHGGGIGSLSLRARATEGSAEADILATSTRAPDTLTMRVDYSFSANHPGVVSGGATMTEIISLATPAAYRLDVSFFSFVNTQFDVLFADAVTNVGYFAAVSPGTSVVTVPAGQTRVTGRFLQFGSTSGPNRLITFTMVPVPEPFGYCALTLLVATGLAARPRAQRTPTRTATTWRSQSSQRSQRIRTL